MYIQKAAARYEQETESKAQRNDNAECFFFIKRRRRFCCNVMEKEREAEKKGEKKKGYREK